MIKKFDLYILREISLPFMVGLIIVSTLLLGDKLYGLFNYLYSGVPVKDIISILLSFIPTIMISAIPASILIGISLGLTKLVKDREIQTVNMIGVRKKRIILPYIILGICSTLFMFYLQEAVIPKNTSNALLLIRKIVDKSPTTLVSSDSILRIDNKFIYVKDSIQMEDGSKELHDVLILSKDDSIRWPTIMTIPVVKQFDEKWLLSSGDHAGENIKTYTPMGANGNNWEISESESGILKLPKEAFDRVSDIRRTPEEYTLKELYYMQKSDIYSNMVSMNTFIPKMLFTKDDLTFYFHKKIATPLSALIITILATALALLFGRNGSYMGMLISAIVAFCSIVSGQWMQVLVENQLINPILAAYLPGTIFLTIGIILLIKE